MTKITLNGAHRWDDRADTLVDAVRIALIEKTVYNIDKQTDFQKQFAQEMNMTLQNKIKLGNIRYGGGSSGGRSWGR
jgi:hypothetical protein